VRTAFNFRLHHYGEQNSDLMPRPGRCASSCPSRRWCGLGLSAFYSEMITLGVVAVFALSGRRELRLSPRLYEQHEQFARQWDRNIRAQAFSRSLHGQVDSRLVRSLRATTRPDVSPASARPSLINRFERSLSWKHCYQC